MVFAEVGSKMKEAYPNVFFDMEWHSDDESIVCKDFSSTEMGEWRIVNRKV
jgi:hypothetical protein